VTVTIRDTGGGMAQDVVSRALDPYFTTKAAGNGLGLAVADAIIQRHGGYIRIVSQLNEGTTVEFILPASPECASCPPAEPAAAANGQGHILVMDDEAVIRNGASRLLPALGYTVTCAADGAEAVEQYEAALTNGSPFDAVVLDLTVPGGMGGEECMKRLRAIDPNVKAIVASGYSLDPAIADHRSYGFLDVVRKPYSPAELAAALRQAMVGSPTR
jgi:CheY-like chemotaxis protein